MRELAGLADGAWLGFRRARRRIVAVLPNDSSPAASHLGPLFVARLIAIRPVVSVAGQVSLQLRQHLLEAAQAQLISAKANLELARLNLSYTKVFAPVNGYVTNMNTSEGTYVTAGKQLIALVDGSSFWIAAYFKETQVPHIQIGQKADLALMGYKQPFQGVVRSIGWGIYVQDGSGSDATGLLPSMAWAIGSGKGPELPMHVVQPYPTSWKPSWSRYSCTPAWLR